MTDDHKFEVHSVPRKDDKDITRGDDGELKYSRPDIGTSPIGQAKLTLAQFFDNTERAKMTEAQITVWAFRLATSLGGVIAEVDKRNAEEMQKSVFVPWIIKKIRRWFS